MVAVRRTQRPVYRVCSEEEFFATPDALADCLVPAPQSPSLERRLRRWAGAAALTGAVGAVGGAIAVWAMRSPTDRRITASDTPSARTVLLAAPSPKAVSVVGGVRARRQGSSPSASAKTKRRMANHRSRVARHVLLAMMSISASAQRPAANTISPPTRRLEHPLERSGSRPSASSTAVVPVPGTSAEAARTASARGEFGFER